MLELAIGFLIGIFAIGLFRAGVISGYMDDVDNLEKENQELKEKINTLVKRNSQLDGENTRYKNRIMDLINKLRVGSDKE